MKIYQKIIFLIAGLILIYGCDSSDIRSKIINKKLSVSELSSDELSQLAISKLNQIKTNKLPDQVAEKIDALLMEVPKYVKGETNSLPTIAVELTSLVPEQDYIAMFYSADDYKMMTDFSKVSPYDEGLLNRLDSISPSLRAIPRGGLAIGVGSKPKLKPRCNCYWVCAPPATSDCIPSGGGCGFLFFQGCTRFEGIILEPK